MIRRLGPKDAGALVNLMLRLPEDWGVKWPEPDPLTCLHWVTRVLTDGVVWGAIEEGKLVGSLGLTPYIPPWTTVAAGLCNEWLLVVKEHRRKGLGKKMLLEADAFVAKHGGAIMMGTVSGADIAANGAFFDSLGYQVLGGQHMKVL